MKATFYIQCIFTLFVSIATASKGGWWKKYSSFEKSQLYMILTKGFDVGQAELHSRDSVEFVSDSKNIKAVQGVLEDIGKTPFDMYDTFVKTLQPGFAELSKDYYKEQRDSSGVSDGFNEFDTKFYGKLDSLTKLFSHGVNWNELEELSSKEEVMCEAAFFYGLIDFERAIACLDAAPSTPLNCEAFSNFVADMYFGEAKRSDFSYEGDAETRKWLDDVVEKYEGSLHSYTASLMRRFTRNIRGKVDDRLWEDYMRAMMTVHLSAALLDIKVDGLKDLYYYLAENGIQDEFMFASQFKDKEDTHSFLRTFKLDPSGETATMGIINSGDGLQLHDKALIDLSEFPDTISEDPHATSAIRYIPFIIYDEVPKKDWGPVYSITDSVEGAYFEGKQRKYEFSDYGEWQYIDGQSAGTCTAMSLWNALYWFERESQQKLESFRLTLHLEVLKGATKKLAYFRTELKELGDRIFEMADNDPARNRWQSAIKEHNDIEDDYLRFFSVGFNSAISSIRYLHDDPFEQDLDMTAVMQDYADFYNSQASNEYWQLVKPNIDSLYTSTYDLILEPEIPLSTRITPKIPAGELACVNEVNQAIKVKNPLNFVKAIVRGTELKCQSRGFLSSIYFGVDALDLQTHHQELILRALAKEVRSLRGGRLSILGLVVKLVNDYSFKLFPSYDVPKNAIIDFTEESHQVVLFKDDTGMKQFAVNCTAFDSPAENVLAAAYGLVKSAKKALSDLETDVIIEDTEEYKLHRNLVQHVASELQSMDPHIYAQYLGGLIWSAEETGTADQIKLFKHSNEWNRDDYELLEIATKGSGSHSDAIKEHLSQVATEEE